MPPKVIMASSEAYPFAKTGGLADVAGALPKALKRLGVDACLFMPYYREAASKETHAEPAGLEVTVPISRRGIKGEILRAEIDGVPVYFIKRDEFFDRSHLYGTPEGDYFDNLERFAFFSRALIEALKSREFSPDIIHANDWQTGLVSAYLRDAYASDLYYSKTKTVFTIHNIAYQGLFAPELMELVDLSPSLFTHEGMEFWGKMSLLKAGIAFSDVVTTVSEAYAGEIQTPEYGAGLDGLLKHRKDDLHGVLNGVDYSEWDPSKDPHIAAQYSPGDMSGKAACRKALVKEFGLKIKAGSPVIGMVSRLAAQKGFDILAGAVPELMKLDIGLVIVGSGERKFQKLLEGLALRYPGRLSVKIAFDNSLAHRVEAGSDIFLMPSHYEPCGLNQIYSLRYGTVPVVRATGGLDDTVRDSGDDKNGFKFKEYSAEALCAKVAEAVKTFADKKAWAAVQASGMRDEFTWEAAARKYLKLYEAALSKVPKT